MGWLRLRCLGAAGEQGDSEKPGKHGRRREPEFAGIKRRFRVGGLRAHEVQNAGAGHLAAVIRVTTFTFQSESSTGSVGAPPAQKPAHPDLVATMRGASA